MKVSGNGNKGANRLISMLLLKLKFKFMVCRQDNSCGEQKITDPQSGTGPSFSFIYKEFSHPSFFNSKEILDKTDMIFCSVSFIELLQSSAWKHFTVINNNLNPSLPEFRNS